ELVKVHQQFGSGEPAAAAVEASADAAVEAAAPHLLASTEQSSQTGEMLKLEVYRNGEATELHACEVGGELTIIPLGAEMLKDLDQQDPWTELFSRVGVSPGPPRRLVVSSLLGRREVNLQPSGTAVILGIYRWDQRRFFLSGLDLASQLLLDLVAKEDTISAELGAQIDACSGDSALFDVLAASLSLEADGTQLTLSGA
ncbi:unnamed protein product, partial [Polarella glacialis]